MTARSPIDRVGGRPLAGLARRAGGMRRTGGTGRGSETCPVPESCRGRQSRRPTGVGRALAGNRRQVGLKHGRVRLRGSHG